MTDPEKGYQSSELTPETRGSRLIVAACGLWILLFMFSIIQPLFTEAEGDGFVRGLNRVMIFLGWQAGAFVLSLIVFFLSRARKSGLSRSVRIAGRVPLLAHVLVLLGFIGFVVFAIATN